MYFVTNLHNIGRRMKEIKEISAFTNRRIVMKNVFYNLHVYLIKHHMIYMQLLLQAQQKRYHLTESECDNFSASTVNIATYDITFTATCISLHVHFVHVCITDHDRIDQLHKIMYMYICSNEATVYIVAHMYAYHIKQLILINCKYDTRHQLIISEMVNQC